MRHLRQPVLLAGIVGAAMAAATNIAMSRWSSDEKIGNATEGEKPNAQENTPPTHQTTLVVRADSSRIASLEKEVDELRAARTGLEQSVGQAPPDDSRVELTYEENHRQLEAMFSGLQRLFGEDPPDPDWSATGTAFLDAGMSAWGQQLGFSVRDVECKTTMCRATVEWEDYAAAQSTGLRLPEREIPGLNCNRHIWLEEPEDPTEPYSADFYLDCTDQRAGLVEVAATDNQGEYR